MLLHESNTVTVLSESCWGGVQVKYRQTCDNCYVRSTSVSVTSPRRSTQGPQHLTIETYMIYTPGIYRKQAAVNYLLTQ